jgi:hypothetical protein
MRFSLSSKIPCHLHQKIRKLGMKKIEVGRKKGGKFFPVVIHPNVVFARPFSAPVIRCRAVAGGTGAPAVVIHFSAVAIHFSAVVIHFSAFVVHFSAVAIHFSAVAYSHSADGAGVVVYKAVIGGKSQHKCYCFYFYRL